MQNECKQILQERRKGKTPFLYIASRRSGRKRDQEQHDDIMKFMLAQGADINAADTYFGRNALMLALQAGHIKLPYWLMAQGIDIHAEDKNGATAIWHAANNRNLYVLDELIERGANINDTDTAWKFTPLMLAINNYDIDLIIHLLDEGALKTIKDAKGRDAVVFAKEKRDGFVGYHTSRGFVKKYDRIIKILTGGISAEEFAKAEQELERRIEEKEEMIDWGAFDW